MSIRADTHLWPVCRRLYWRQRRPKKIQSSEARCDWPGTWPRLLCVSLLCCDTNSSSAPITKKHTHRISSIYISGRTWWILLLSNQICVFKHDWCGTWRRTCRCSQSAVKIKNTVTWRSSATPSVDNETGFSLLKLPNSGRGGPLLFIRSAKRRVQTHSYRTTPQCFTSSDHHTHGQWGKVSSMCLCINWRCW